jgi:conjugal transfer ATP-binding protein TraC
MITKLMDTGRAILACTADLLGETTGVALGSRRDAKAARLSLQLLSPSFRSLLPYESINDENLFVNKQTVGFGLHIQPLSGADDALVKSMAQWIKTKLPVGVDCTVMLYKHGHIAQTIGRGFASMIDKGGIYARLAQLSIEYHMNAVKNGYKNGRNLPAQLADYRGFLFFSMKRTTDAFNQMEMCRLEIESELSVAGFYHARLKQTDFLIWMKTIVCPNTQAMHWPNTIQEPNSNLSQLVGSGNMVFHEHDLHVDIHSSDDDGTPILTRVINCQIEKWPENLALWQTPDLFANLLKPENGLPCSFLISFTIRSVDQERALAKAKSRAKTLNANANSVQLFLNPKARDEAAAWNYIHEEGSRDNLALLPTFYNLMLFTTPDREREVVASAISAYRQVGFELQQSRGTQWIRYLASLPFMMTEGFFDDLTILGLTKQMTHYSVANCMPIVADTKGSSQGMLLPTSRNQLAFFDPFDSVNLPITNYNFLTVGSSGAGKSMFQQALLYSGLAMGEITYVIDLGHSYKHLCELLGGIYIDVAKMPLNPFTLFDFEGSTELPTLDGTIEEVSDSIQIRDLLAIMASPNQAVCDIQKSYLLDAAHFCWKEKGKKACIDDVLEALRDRLTKAESKDDPRLNDLIILLKKYGREGMYGHLFNGETPNFKQSKFVVFEMSSLQDNPDLATIVMFAMIVIIQGQFYQTSRTIRKRCVIDEAWRFLTQGSNPITAQFIEQGFRTARKHNGGFGVTTQYLDDTSGSIQGQAIAASSDIKLILRQGNFDDYVIANPTRFTPFEQKMIRSFDSAESTGFASVMIEAGEARSFHRYFADPYSRVLLSSKGAEFEAVESFVKAGMSLEDAVHQVVNASKTVHVS